MTEHQSFNAAPSMDTAEIDRINSAFYGRFNYPWAPMVIPSFEDPNFMVRFINQEVGDFNHRRIPRDARIWVAGCGANQAVLAALRFPDADVLGTDISPRSLEVARASADPEVPLATLAQALKPDSVLELMVYNFYHRTQTTANQKAIRLLSGATGRGALSGNMAPFLTTQRDLPEPAVADSLLQPEEFSYTVDTLAAMCARAGLSILQSCINQFDRLSQQFSWEPPLPDGLVRDAFDALDDMARRQVVNPLMLDASPMWWFYIGRDTVRQTCAQFNAHFLDHVFAPAVSPVGDFQHDEHGHYIKPEHRTLAPAPAQPTDTSARAVFAACDDTYPISDIVSTLGLPLDAASITRLKGLLTTPAFPYLVAT